MLSFGEKIKQARKEKRMTQKELARRIGAAHNSISDWENDKNKPDPDTIELLCGVLEISPNYLLDSKTDDFSPAERNLIAKYRALDKRGQETVNFILDDQLFMTRQMARINLVPYPFAGYIAAAGRWVYEDSIPTEIISAPPMAGADFVIGISGNSMAPTFQDHDRVYVAKCDALDYGDVGLFLVDGYYYVKEYAEDGLRSHNAAWPVISKDREIIIVGKVLGKVEE